MTAAPVSAHAIEFVEPSLGGYTLELPDPATLDDPAWLDVTQLAPATVDELMARATAQANTTVAAVPATWIVEKAAWFLSAAALAQLLQLGRFVAPTDMRLLHGDTGWAEAVASPAPHAAVHGPEELAHQLEVALTPLVDRFAEHRARRALWLSVSDRLAQAVLFAGPALSRSDEAVELVSRALATPGVLRSPARFTSVDGSLQRRRVGCCLSYRCDDGARCADCPVQPRD